MLCKEDLYEDACELLIAFDISLEQPVISLAKKYCCVIGHATQADIEAQLTGFIFLSLVNLLLYLTSELLERREKRDTSSTLYLVASEEILKFGCMLPDQIYENYKRRDMNEVLRLLAKYGEIEEAVGVAVEILKKAKLIHLNINKPTFMMNVPVLLIEQVI